MLPHGTRPAHSPRSTTPTSRRAVPSQVNDIAILAVRRPGTMGSMISVRVMTAAPPSLSTISVVAKAVTLRRPAAKENAKKTIARVSTSMDA